MIIREGDCLDHRWRHESLVLTFECGCGETILVTNPDAWTVEVCQCGRQWNLAMVCREEELS